MTTTTTCSCSRTWHRLPDALARALGGLALLAISSCSSDEGAGAGLGTGGGSAGAARGGASGTEGGGNGRAAWPIPHPPDSGLPNPERYTTLPDGVVRSEVTGLSWQQAPVPGPGEGGGWVWQDAAEQCATLALAGDDDWRLPSRMELVSLVDYTRSAPAIDGEAFPGTATDWFWTSSAVPDTDPRYYYYVNFYFGNATTNDTVYAMQVRCVRGGAGSAVPYEIESDLVRDPSTGLVWQRAAAPDPLEFAGASAYCDSLELGAYDDFRAPSVAELESLVDEGRRDPALDPVAFPDASAEPFWSSSELAGDPTNAWYVFFDDGFTLYDPVDAAHRVRCVRRD